MAIFGHGFSPAMTEMLCKSSGGGVPVAAGAIRAGPGGTAVIDCSQHGGFSIPSHRGPTQLGFLAPAGLPGLPGLPWASGGAVVRPCGESRSYAGVLPTRTFTPPPVEAKPKAEPVRNVAVLVYFQVGDEILLMMHQLKEDTVGGACSLKAGYSTIPLFPIEKKHRFPSDMKQPPKGTQETVFRKTAELLHRYIPCISSADFRANMKKGTIRADSDGDKHLFIVCDMREEKFFTTVMRDYRETPKTMKMRTVFLPEAFAMKSRSKEAVMHLPMTRGEDPPLPYLDIEPDFRQPINEAFTKKDMWLH